MIHATPEHLIRARVYAGLGDDTVEYHRTEIDDLIASILQRRETGTFDAFAASVESRHARGHREAGDGPTGAEMRKTRMEWAVVQAIREINGHY